MADGIIFERLGVPAVSIVTDAFGASSDAMATLQGMPGYAYAMIPHPLSSLTQEQCAQRGDELMRSMLDIVGVDRDGQRAGARPDSDSVRYRSALDSPHLSDSTFDVSAEDVAISRRIAEYYFDQVWTDGLPVMPVDAVTVREFVSYVGRDPNEEAVSIAHLNSICTVELAAVAAAMAGCKKEHFPVVLAAAKAMQESVATGLLQSTTGQAQMVIVNGPCRVRNGFNSSTDVFGPGFRANATVGRTLRLIALNVFKVRPGILGQATQGTPGKYTLCIAENEEESPWEPLHVTRGFSADSSVVTVHFARSTLHVENRSSDNPKEVLATIADSMSYLGGMGIGGYTVVMGPEHAQLLARRGWSRDDVTQFLWENWGRTKSDIRRCGLLHDDLYAPESAGPLSNEVAPDSVDDDFVHFGKSPQSLLLVVAGSRNAGVSTVVPAQMSRTHTTSFFSEQVDEVV